MLRCNPPETPGTEVGNHSDWDAEVDDFPDEPFESFDSFEDEYLSENDITVRNEGVKIVCKDKCQCGSGKKYTKCCGRNPDLSLQMTLFDEVATLFASSPTGEVPESSPFVPV